MDRREVERINKERMEELVAEKIAEKSAEIDARMRTFLEGP